MDTPRRAVVAREWIIFALSIGLGAHIALALLLHAPEAWPLQQAGLYGLFMGSAVYVVVQLARSIWWLFRPKASSPFPEGEPR